MSHPTHAHTCRGDAAEQELCETNPLPGLGGTDAAASRCLQQDTRPPQDEQFWDLHEGQAARCPTSLTSSPSVRQAGVYQGFG